MAFQIPVFHPAPATAIANEADPTTLEITAFRTNIVQFTNAAGPALIIGNPQRGFALALPNNPAVSATAAVCITRLEELR